MAQTEQANKARHPDPIMEPGDIVWLKRKNIRTTRPSNKLDHKQIGPYTILEKVGSRAYRLDLPASVKLHPVFHIRLREPTASTEPIPGHHQPPPPPPLSAAGQPSANDHVSLHWTACYDDYCGAHRQMKDENYYPQRGNDRRRRTHWPCSCPHAHPFKLAEVIRNRHLNPRKACADWQ